MAYLDHGSDSLKANLCKVIIKQSLATRRADNVQVAERLCAVVEVLSRAIPAMFESKLSEQLQRVQDGLDDEQLLTLAAGVGRSPLVWAHLKDGARGRLEQRIDAASLSELSIGHALFQPVPGGEIGDLLVKRFRQHLLQSEVGSDEPTIAAIVQHADGRIASALVDMLTSADRFRQAEAALSYLVNCSRVLTISHVSAIGKGYLDNPQAWRAFNAPRILHEVWIRTISTTELQEAWNLFAKKAEERLAHCGRDSVDGQHWESLLHEVGPKAPPF